MSWEGHEDGTTGIELCLIDQMLESINEPMVLQVLFPDRARVWY